MSWFFDTQFKAIKQQTLASYQKLTGKAAVFSKVISGLPLLASAEVSTDTKYDDKHYFVIPFKLSEHGVALHTMRSLPEGVPEFNDLPKRRIFHFANPHGEAQLKELLLKQAIDTVTEKSQGNISTLESLADSIDAIDSKLTYGMLLVGGLAALVNPILGAGIAAKAIIPSASGLLNKHGIRPLGEKLTQKQLETEINQAQKNIQAQFSEANTLKIINPILQELEFTLNTTEQQHDPLIDFDLSKLNIEELAENYWREHTITAIKHVYNEVLKNPKLQTKAHLEAKTLRWLKVMLTQQS
ncbi:hypothetical protein [Catenovulum sediminis]|uniref:Uncharacterized protein n=1 Tax=Catenovulum sediminis TaxID=1740262 RepID=A0ABV1RG63_9ALTE|nr:hypothetical protein [Catenovulum sediminis]